MPLMSGVVYVFEAVILLPVNGPATKEARVELMKKIHTMTSELGGRFFLVLPSNGAVEKEFLESHGVEVVPEKEVRAALGK